MNILNVVHGIDGSLGIGLLTVADETEASAATSVTVLDNDLQGIKHISWVFSNNIATKGGKLTYSLLNGTELLELLAKSILISVPCKAAAGRMLVIDRRGPSVRS